MIRQIPDPEFSPEQEVLLWAIRIDNMTDQRVAGILKAGIDWKYVRKTAIQNGIIPLLYQRLKGKMAESVPSDELVALKILFRENSVRNIRITHQLFKTLDLLAGSGVEAMPFKGPVLAVQAYGDLSMRSFRDLDILIHFNEVDRAYRILNGHGYLLSTPGQMNIERKFGFLDQKDLQFTYQDYVLELHWKFIERFRAVSLDMKEVWDRSIPVVMDGRKLATLSPEDMVLLLCFHGNKHGWCSLGWIADLVSMISNHPDLCWDDLFTRAENLGLKRITFTGLILAHHYGGIRYSPEIENRLMSDTAVQKLARELQIDFFHSQTQFISPFAYLKSRERFRDQILFFLYYSINRVLVLLRWLIRPLARSKSSSEK